MREDEVGCSPEAPEAQCVPHRVHVSKAGTVLDLAYLVEVNLTQLAVQIVCKICMTGCKTCALSYRGRGLRKVGDMQKYIHLASCDGHVLV
jgi:hypothetical protein